MRIYHDNKRPAPSPDWTLARSNHEAADHLKRGYVAEISMDYDMGGHNGLDLARWMVHTGNVPPEVVIHSTNPEGARKMANELSRFNPKMEPAHE